MVMVFKGWEGAPDAVYGTFGHISTACQASFCSPGLEEYSGGQLTGAPTVVAAIRAPARVASSRLVPADSVLPLKAVGAAPLDL
jgi:hypothetical protein